MQGSLGALSSSFATVAYSILAVTFLMGVYEAFLTGGSLRKFAAVIIKYAVAYGVIANWSQLFNDVVGLGNTISGYVLSAGGQDLLSQWIQNVQQMLTTGPTWTGIVSLVSGAGMIPALILGGMLISLVALIIAMLLMKIAFAFWGGILFCIGQLLIALAPSQAVNDLAKRYCNNLAQWVMWPVLYSIFCLLLANANLNNVSQAVATMTSSGYGNVAGLGDQNIINAFVAGILTLLYALCLILIPFIARAILDGNFNAVWSSATGLAQQAASLAAGNPGFVSVTNAAEIGAAAGGGGGGGGVGGGGAGVSSGSSGSSEPSMSQSSAPPHSAADDTRRVA